MLLATLCLTPDCQALYIQFETEKVPVERILENLQTKLKQQPDSFDLHYQLARAHAMAAFTESGELTVYKSKNPPGAVQYSEGGGDNGTPLDWGFRHDTNDRLNGREIGKNLSRSLKHYQVAIGLLRKTEDHAKIRSEISKVHLGYAWMPGESRPETAGAGTIPGDLLASPGRSRYQDRSTSKPGRTGSGSISRT